LLAGLSGVLMAASLRLCSSRFARLSSHSARLRIGDG
jgi:hypothetical protein